MRHAAYDYREQYELTYRTRQDNRDVKYLRSGPNPDATVSLTVRMATLNSEPSDLPVPTLLSLLCCVTRAGTDDGILLVPVKPIISEMIIASKEVPAGIKLPEGGSSNKAFADFIFKSRLLIW